MMSISAYAQFASIYFGDRNVIIVTNGNKSDDRLKAFPLRGRLTYIGYRIMTKLVSHNA